MKQLVTLAALALTGFAMADIQDREFNVNANPEVHLNNISGSVTVKSGAVGVVKVRADRKDDRIRVEFSQEGNRVYIKTVFPDNANQVRGGVSYELTVPETAQLDVNSVSGSIRVSGVSGTHDLQTVSGSLEIVGLDGDLSLNTVSGSIEIRDVRDASVDANSISGGVTYEGDLLGGPYRFSSTSGSVRLTYTEAAAFHISGNTVSGNIDAGNSGLTVSKAKYGPTRSLSGAVNGNGTSVHVSSVSGSVTIRKK